MLSFDVTDVMSHSIVHDAQQYNRRLFNVIWFDEITLEWMCSLKMNIILPAWCNWCMIWCTARMYISLLLLWITCYDNLRYDYRECAVNCSMFHISRDRSATSLHLVQTSTNHINYCHFDTTNALLTLTLYCNSCCVNHIKYMFSLHNVRHI